MIDQRIRTGRREDAERHRNADGNDQAQKGELGRGGEPCSDLIAYRLASGERSTEIALARSRTYRTNCT